VAPKAFRFTPDGADYLQRDPTIATRTLGRTCQLANQSSRGVGHCHAHLRCALVEHLARDLRIGFGLPLTGSIQGQENLELSGISTYETERAG
jgi:hypothetical protein